MLNFSSPVRVKFLVKDPKTVFLTFSFLNFPEEFPTKSCETVRGHFLSKLVFSLEKGKENDLLTKIVSKRQTEIAFGDTWALKQTGS